MDIRIFQEHVEENEKKEVYIFNPTSQEFTINFRGKKYTSIPSAELKLPYYGAELMVSKIVDYMVGRKLSIGKFVSPAEREEIAKRVRLYEQNNDT